MEEGRLLTGCSFLTPSSVDLERPFDGGARWLGCVAMIPASSIPSPAFRIFLYFLQHTVIFTEVYQYPDRKKTLDRYRPLIAVDPTDFAIWVHM